MYTAFSKIEMYMVIRLANMAEHIVPTMSTRDITYIEYCLIYNAETVITSGITRHN